MSNTYEAKKGLVTFVLTLVIATGIFLTAYVAVNSLNTQATNQELSDRADSFKNEQTVTEKTSPFAALLPNSKDQTGQVAGTADSKTEQTNSKNALTEPKQLATASKPSVLAGSSVAPQSTGGGVPRTGSESMVAVLLVGFLTIAAGIFFKASSSRRLAIKTFEQKIRNEF